MAKRKRARRSKSRRSSIERERRAVIYVRVSSREQEKGYSIEAQTRACREHVESENLVLAHEPFVEAHSARSSGRPVFREMLQWISKDGEIGVVVAHKVDRLSRNLTDLALLSEKLLLRPSIVAQQLPKDDEGQCQFTFNFLAIMAQYFSQNLRTEVIKGQMEKARQGGTPHHAPHGYLHLKSNPGGVPKLDPARASGLRRLFKDAATGLYTLDELRERAFCAGYRYSARTPRIPRTTLDRILKNPYYIGEVHFRNEINPGRHEALITRELFERVQRARTRSPGGYGSSEIPYRGMMHCTCGRTITGERKKKRLRGGGERHYFYYRCARYRECGGQRLTLAEVESELGRIVQAVRLPQDRVTWVCNALALARRQESQQRESAIRALEQQARQARERLDAAFLEKLDGRINDDEFLRVRDRLREQEGDALLGLEAHRKAGQASLRLAERVLGLANRAYSLWLRQEHEERQRLVQLLCLNLTLDGETLIPEMRKPFDLLAKGLSHSTYSRRDLNLRPPDPQAA